MYGFIWFEEPLLIQVSEHIQVPLKIRERGGCNSSEPAAFEHLEHVYDAFFDSGGLLIEECLDGPAV